MNFDIKNNKYNFEITDLIELLVDKHSFMCYNKVTN